MLRVPNFEPRISRWNRKLQNIIVNNCYAHTKVLLYHRVNKLTQDPLQLSVTPDIFYEQLNWLKKKYRIISIEELSDSLLQQKKIKKHTILITFDDGYADNYNIALPILTDLQIPAVFFIATALLNTDEEQWWDELVKIVVQNNLPEKISLSHIDDIQHTISTKNKNTFFSTLHDMLKFSDLNTRNNIMSSLRIQADIKNDIDSQNRMMSYMELQALGESPWATIGAHTVNHLSLGMQEASHQEREIIESKVKLEQIIDKPVHYFAYPYGTTKDFNHITLKLMEKAGFKLAFANYHGFAAQQINRYKIPRILVRNYLPQQLYEVVNKSF